MGAVTDGTGEVGDRSRSALASLVLLLRFHGIAADPEQIAHRFGGGAIGPTEMVRLARELGLKARRVSSHWARLARTPFPAIAEQRDGTFLVLGKVSDKGALVQDALSGRVQVMERAAFEAAWGGWLAWISTEQN